MQSKTEQTLKKRNAKLKEELAAKNREIEIEAALEIVRGRSMSMQKSEELKEVIQLVYEQFVLLNIHIEHTGFLIDYKVRDDMHIWLADQHLIPSEVIIPWFDSPPNNSIKEAKEKGQDFFKYLLTFEEKNKFYRDLFKFVPDVPEESLDYYFNCPGLAGSGVLLDNIGLYIENFSGTPYTDVENNVLMRFGKVFQQTYTRFLDLQKAEGQAREAKIEAALERVRSSSLAMHSSEELQMVTNEIFVRLTELNIVADSANILIFQAHSKDIECWTASPTSKNNRVIFPYVDYDLQNDLINNNRAGTEIFTSIYTKEQKDAFFAYHFEKSELRSLSRERKEFILNAESYNVCVANCKAIAININRYFDLAFSTSDKNILYRFAKVFYQCYTRFLDLQKAEAQARESQIQLALERVRARTMAMQKSEELQETSLVLFQQLKELGEPAEQLSIGIMNEAENAVEISATLDGKKFQQTFRHSGDEPFVMNKIVTAWKAQQKSLIIEQSTEELEAYNKFRNELTGSVKFPIRLQPGERRILYIAFFSKGMLGLSTSDPRPKESIELLERFASVFDLTYTRFSDLKQAEAQAREAQIETSLERIRSRTMGMQTSNELRDVAALLNKELISLGITQFATCGYVEIEEKNNRQLSWLTNPDGASLEAFYLPLTGEHIFNERYDAWKRKDIMFKQVVYAKELKKHLDFAYSGFGSQESENVGRNFFPDPTIFYNCNFSYGYLSLVTGVMLNEAEELLLARFTRVFEQTYSRFLDLQKAEAQAREAKIETALEKVRSRSLAMHKSEEIQEVINEVFIRLKELEINLDSANILIFENGTKDVVCWTGSTASNSTSSLLRYADIDFIMDLIKAKENQLGLFTHQYSREQKNNFFNYVYESTALKETPDDRKQFILGAACHTVSVAFSKNIAINLNSYSRKSFAENENNIASRFAKVFDQSYTRFLDLQKAEAQAREAQIQLALERVRARAMAMQQSEELAETASVLFQQMNTLGNTPERLNIGVINEEKGFIETWATEQGGNQINHSFNARLDEPTTIAKMYEGWKAKKTSMIVDISGKELKQWIHFLQDELKMPVNEEILQNRRVQSVAYFKEGFILMTTPEPLPAETISLLERFADVFNLTYTRFLDLQKAEAQAKEAQIEASLERVRSHTIAMHKSADLLEVISVLSEQFLLLGFKIHSANFNTSYREKDWNLWLYNPGTPMFPDQIHIPYLDNPFFNRTLESITNGADFTAFVFTKEEKDGFLDHLYSNTIVKNTSEERKRFAYDAPGFAWSTVYLKNTALTIANYDAEPYSEEQNAIIRRFGNVFEQSYTRFLDLQKAEAQTKEAQIELGLERVRARAMAMHSSEELKEVVRTLFEELTHLDVNLQTCLITTFDAATFDQRSWMIHLKTNEPYNLLIPHNEQLFYQEMLKAWKERNHSWTYMLENEAKIKWESFLFSDTDFRLLPKEVKERIQRTGKVFFAASYYNYGAIQVSSLEPFSNQSIDILQRFSKVFDSSYTRFLDLQKAEAQAREAQIELGLERVRAKAMAMQKSDELKELIGTVFTELTKLDLALTRSVIWIFDAETNGTTWWMANSEDPENPMDCYIPYSQHPRYLAFLEQWEKRTIKFQYELKGENKKNWDDYLFSKTGLARLPGIVIEGMKAPEKVWLSASFNNFGAMHATSLDPLSDEHFDILLRFAKVFDLTYTRFNDLKQAEAQAREAEIQLALERVRAKAMAMHNSNDVSVAASMVFSELRKLGINPIRCGVGLLNKESRKAQLYSATSSDDADSLSLVGWVMLKGHPVLENIYEAWLKKEDYYPELTGAQLKSYYENLLAGLSLPIVPNSETGEKQYGHFFSFSAGCLYTWSDRHYNDSEIRILKRFAGIIDLTFRRYLDLQKAEANAKEAKIEASLERVRGKAMSMHSSRDLADTIEVFYHEVESLSITPRRCGVGLMDKETHFVELSTMNTTELGESIEIIGKLKLEGHPVLEGIYDNWILQKEYHPVLRGDEIKQYYQLIRPQIAYPDYPTDTTQYGYFFFFNEGGVYAWTEKELSEGELKIYRRFTSVLSLTYKRYKDLKDAEANTKEAIKQASLDRVRAETASMRTTRDLEKITPLIWNELTTLRVPFIRCGVFIMDEQQKQIHSFLSTPDGKAIAAFQLPYHSAGELSKVLAHWHKNEIFKDHWDEATFVKWTKSLVNQGAIASEEQYSTAHRPVNLDLNFLPFLQGMLYVGSEASLSEEEIHLVQSLADAFSTAYARYEDFNKLEAAKKQVDSTLNELQATQKQLVQSEKMASLGELTAGIAHEIQNPLNFVNNFSDVNKELLIEMKDEMQKGNIEDAKAIADDVIENEEKINHHGKRAGDIVKGMLQHSRKSTGQKEPTDINALADEYLRLSYHGLRAKDKTFNATMKTDFDKTIGKINVIPQDIGRVLLNLFNNAFYAVNEQKTRNPELYNPIVTVTTMKCDDKVQIIVKDNGNGIPQKIVDKIFQPFFTTKPTGQGTGLGLSLAYDIIKVHGGTLKVESKEGEGSTFIIQLPVA